MYGIEWYTDYGFNVNPNCHDKQGHTALTRAAMDGDIEMISKLLRLEHINVNARNEDKDPPLVLSILHGHLDIAEMLIAANANLNPCDKRPLVIALKHGYLGLAERLIAAGANNSSNRDDRSPLDIAIEEGYIDIVRIMLKKYYVMPLRDRLLKRAISDRNDDMIELLRTIPSINVVYNPHLNQKDSEGKTPLIRAIESVDIELITKLLSEGADPNMTCD